MDEPGAVRVRLLGDFELRPPEGEPLRLDSTRAESLLGYLALHAATPQPRQVFAALLWPESTEGQARTNLRHLLHTLRQSVELGHPDLLTAASDRSADDVVAGLDELWARRIVREHGAEGYDFSHGKIREVAYGGISPPRRARLSHRIAEALARPGEQTPARCAG